MGLRRPFLNAVENAIGISFCHVPLLPEDVLQALEQTAGSGRLMTRPISMTVNGVPPNGRRAANETPA